VREICVWAPRAQTVQLALAESRAPMGAADGGWWHGTLPDDGQMDYGFIIDDSNPLPDPRSAFQPHGVHGLSRIVDHSAFQWTDRDWRPGGVDSAVIYELHVGTFSPEGTFDGAIPRLDHLVKLGITHVEIMPVAEFSGSRGWGYDGVDLYAPHHVYGGPDGLKRLVDACHSRGLAVILDVVYNHLGPAGNYLSQFGPYFSQRYATPWGEAVNFDGPGSDEVRRFFIDNGLMWLRDYHIDGLRLDAVHAILDMSAVHFLEQLAGEVAALQAELGRPLLLIAESDLNDPRLVNAPGLGGYGLHAQWSDDFHHALHSLLTEERDGYYADFGDVQTLARALERGYVFEGQYSAFRERRHGRERTGLTGHHLLGYLQNHDQIGNRARGDRSAALMSPGRLMIGAALVLTSAFTPMLFQGEEWAASTPFLYFTDHEPELGRAVTAGRRSEFAAFGWDPVDVPDPQNPSSLERSRLDWSEPRDPSHKRILEWHRRLIALRRMIPELRDGDLDHIHVEPCEDPQWLIMRRSPILVATNLSDQPVALQLRADDPSAIVMSSDPNVRLAETRLHLGAEQVVILGPEKVRTALLSSV
jgi:maltooligosyltrehalose trehalohydrolase